MRDPPFSLLKDQSCPDMFVHLSNVTSKRGKGSLLISNELEPEMTALSSGGIYMYFSVGATL